MFLNLGQKVNSSEVLSFMTGFKISQISQKSIMMPNPAYYILLWLILYIVSCSDLTGSGLPNGVCLLENQACGMHDNVVSIVNSINSLDQCTELCQDEDSCTFVTFYGENSFPFSQTCIMFSSCDDIVVCDDCTTEDSTCKEVSCTTSESLDSRIGDR